MGDFSAYPAVPYSFDRDEMEINMQHWSCGYPSRDVPEEK